MYVAFISQTRLNCYQLSYFYITTPNKLIVFITIPYQENELKISSSSMIWSTYNWGYWWSTQGQPRYFEMGQLIVKDNFASRSNQARICAAVRQNLTQEKVALEGAPRKLFQRQYSLLSNQSQTYQASCHLQSSPLAWYTDVKTSFGLCMINFWLFSIILFLYMY